MDQIISTKILRNVVFFFAEFQNLFVLPLGVFGLCVLVLFSPPWDFCCQLLIGLHFTGHECVCKLPYEGRVAFVWIVICIYPHFKKVCEPPFFVKTLK